MNPEYRELTTHDTDPAIPHLCSFEGCPFAQTTRIVLAYKGVRFRHSEVPVFNEEATQIADKPDWFMELSPKGRVPILQHNGRVLHESAVIDEYLEETYPGSPLLPADQWRRAIARLWLRNVSVTLPKFWYRALVSTGEEWERNRDRLFEFFEEFDEALGEFDGPWLLGDFYSLVDVFITPFYERFDAVHRHYGKFELPREERFERVHTHWRAAREHPSYLATRLDPEWLVHIYRPFARDEEWISADNNEAVRDIVD